MKHPAKLLLLTSLAVATNIFAATNVTFTAPEKYIDMPFSSSGKDEVMRELRAHFAKLGAKLPKGEALTIEVLDIDLAGRIEPTRFANPDLRVLNGGADWPMIRLRYTLEVDGKVIKNGEDRIADLAYLNHYNRYTSTEPLRFEKQMLDDWFRKTLLTTGDK